MPKEFSQSPQDDLPPQILYANYVHSGAYIPHVLAESREPSDHRGRDTAVLIFAIGLGVGIGVGGIGRQVIEELPADAHGTAVCTSKDFIFDITATDTVGKPLPVHWEGDSSGEQNIGDYDIHLPDNDFYSLTVTCGAATKNGLQEGIIEEHGFVPAEAKDVTVFCDGPEGSPSNKPVSPDGCEATYY